MGLFGKTPQKDPKEQVREWSSNMRKEGRKLDRQIRTIKGEEAKVQVSIKDAAKKGQKDVCYILAKEIIQSRKAVNKIYATKAHLNSVDMQMKNQLATLRLAGCLEKSTEVMRGMSALVKVPEIQEIMQQMSKEMMKAGIMEEMLEDTFEGMEDQDELEEAAADEVEKILFEVTSGVLGQVGPVAAGGLEAPPPYRVTSGVLGQVGPVAAGGLEAPPPYRVTSGVLGQVGPVAAGGLEAPAGAEAAGDGEELDDMHARLEALRS